MAVPAEQMPHPVRGQGDAKFPCPKPDCDRTFVTKQGLGRHRASVHGYVGRRSRKRAKAKPPAPPQASSLHELGLDVVLRGLFPEGIPPERYEEVVRWVDVTLALRR